MTWPAASRVALIGMTPPSALIPWWVEELTAIATFSRTGCDEAQCHELRDMYVEDSISSLVDAFIAVIGVP